MNRSALFAALLLAIIGTAAAPLFPPTAALSPVVVFPVCFVGALAGLWTVSYALSLD